MADWIHCNKCFIRYQSNIKFFLTECGHLKCQRCRNIMNDHNNDCLVCNKKQVHAILLTNDIKPDIQCFFKSLTQLLNNVKSVYEFQNTNQMNLMKNLYSKYAYAKKEVVKSYAIISEIKKENSRLKIMLGRKSQGGGGTGYATSTPLSNSNFSLINDSISTMPKDPNFTLPFTPGSQVAGHISQYSRPGHAQRLSNKHAAPVNSLYSTPSPSVQVVPGSRPISVPIHRSITRSSLNNINMKRSTCK